MLTAVCGCSASTPERTLEGFLSARVRGDDARAAELTVEGDLSGFLGGEPFLAGSEVSWEVGAAALEGDRAVTTVRFAWSGGEADIPYVCRREGAKWKVALRETEEMWLSEPPGEGGGGKEDAGAEGGDGTDRGTDGEEDAGMEEDTGAGGGAETPAEDAQPPGV